MSSTQKELPGLPTLNLAPTTRFSFSLSCGSILFPSQLLSLEEMILVIDLLTCVLPIPHPHWHVSDINARASSALSESVSCVFVK